MTATCNRSCEYCFALDVLETRAPQAMTTATFERTLDLATQSGISEIRLLGGEPTIHRQFIDFVQLALDRGMRVVVLSGGLIPQKALTYLHSTPDDRVSMLMNVVPPWEDEPAMHNKQERVMRLMGPRIALGLNIDHRGIEFDFLLRAIDKFGLKRTVRLGITHPVLQGKNSWLNPKHYSVVGERVARFAYEANAANVSISFDCGWVPCMFPDGVLEDLGYGPQDVGLRCSPILDVLADDSVISCYPLAEHARIELDAGLTTHQMRRAFSDKQQADRTATIFPHCTSCENFRAERCTGGCLSASLRRRRSIGDRNA